MSTRQKAIGFESGICRRSWLFVLVGLVLAITCVCISFVLRSDEKATSKSGERATPKKVRVYPPQKTVLKFCVAQLKGKIEEALSFSVDCPDKDKLVKLQKTIHEQLEFLEYTIGPVEIRVNETLDKATLVAVPYLSATSKNRSTGKIRTLPEPGSKILETILEKRKTAEGWHWFIVREPEQWSRLASVWLHQPRTKVADSATIVLTKDIEKNAIIMQILSDGEVVSEKILSEIPPLEPSQAVEAEGLEQEKLQVKQNK